MEQYLSKEIYSLNDGNCGEPIIWYRKLVGRVPEDVFNMNRHRLEYLNLEFWGYIERVITRKECIEKYGEITNEEYGPRGGWKSVTFGNKKFMTDKLHPSREIEIPADLTVTI